MIVKPLNSEYHPTGEKMPQLYTSQACHLYYKLLKTYLQASFPAWRECCEYNRLKLTLNHYIHFLPASRNKRIHSDVLYITHITHSLSLSH